MIFEFDAAASTIDGANPGTALVVPGGNYGVEAFNAPAPPLEAQYAGSVDTEGGAIASRKHGNRQISMTIACLSAAALRSLQDKVAKIAREGGTLKVTWPASSEVVIFDLHAADTFEPQLDIAYSVNSGSFCEVRLSFVAKPYGRGPEEDLGDNSETTLPVLIFTEAGIKGDIPALGRLVVDDDSLNGQSSVWWGVQSRYYSSDSTAKLFYQAESTHLVLATSSTLAGASGTSSACVLDSSLSNSAWRIQFSIADAGPVLATHQGNFRVFARVQAPSSNAGTVSVRLDWQPSSGRAVENQPVAIDPTYEGQWLLVDLGEVAIKAHTRGAHAWLGNVSAMSTSTNDDLYTDCIFLLPIDESSGQVVAISGSLFPPIPSGSGASIEIAHDGGFSRGSGGTSWFRVPSFEGDYLRIPSAGLEGRTARVIVKASRGTFASRVCVDSAIDDISARLYVTPRYLVVPSP